MYTFNLICLIFEDLDGEVICNNTSNNITHCNFISCTFILYCFRSNIKYSFLVLSLRLSGTIDICIYTYIHMQL